MVLLDILSRKFSNNGDAKFQNISIAVAHIDHGLREESAEESRLVRSVAEEHGVKFHLKKLEPSQSAFAKFGGIEAWAREARYSFLAKIREQYQYDLILTAHHKLDVIETFLFKAITNRRLRALRFCDEKRLIARPFFNIDKECILAYAKERRIDYLEDSSNSNSCYTRNRIRMTMVEALPKVEACGINSLFKTSVATEDDYERIERFVARLVSKEPFGTKTWIAEVKDCLQRYPEFDWWLIEANLWSVLGYQLGKKHALRFVQFLGTSNTSNLEIPGWIIRKKGGEMIAQKQSTKSIDTGT